MKRLLVVVLILGWSNVQAQVTARWDTTEQVVGGMVVLEAEFAGEEMAVKPDAASVLLWLSEEVDSTGENTIYRWTAMAVDTGEVRLEGWAVEPLVIGFLPAMEGLEKEQNREPIDVPFSLWWWILAYDAPTDVPFSLWSWILAYKWWLLGGLLLLALAWYLWRNWNAIKMLNHKIYEQEAVEDPYETALQALKKIRETRPWELDAKQYYVELGDLVRHYLSIRSGLPLAEHTTDEAIALVKMKWLSTQLEDYAFIMSRADVVKFAKGSADVETHLSCLAKAEALIDQFKPEQHGG
jgi:hypothetical protein